MNQSGYDERNRNTQSIVRLWIATFVLFLIGLLDMIQIESLKSQIEEMKVESDNE